MADVQGALAGLRVLDLSDHRGVLAGRMLALMAELGGAELVGEATTLPEGLFADVE